MSAIALIKRINEKMPYWMKKPFAKTIRNKLIHNIEFIKMYECLIKYDSLSKKEKEIYQLINLKSVLQHAYNHTAYYHKLFDNYHFNPEEMQKLEDVQKLPVLRQEGLRKHLKEIVSDDIDDFYLVTTGGTTTGETISVQMEKKAIYREWAFVYHYWSKFGYDYRSSRLATFRGVNLRNKISEVNPLYSEIRMNPFLLNATNIEKYLERIDKYGADFIYGYPSVVYNFCRIANEKDIDLTKKFKAALLISENLYDFQEKMITTVLDCKIAMFYGHSERAVFGEKSDGGYIFNPLYGIVEINSDSELMVTGFINQKTPLIRYMVDDMVKSIQDGRFDIIGHRTCEVLYGKKGEQISAASINFHDDTFSNIKGYQFVQNEVGKCILNIVSGTNVDDIMKKKIRKRVREKLGNGFEVSVCQVDKLELSARGKYRMVVQQCK